MSLNLNWYQSYDKKAKNAKDENICFCTKSAISSKVRVNTVPLECQMLRKEILKKHADIFKDKIGKMDRVNIPPVKLQLDES